ncbi:hypothetical protein CLV86_2016 [Lacinutrix venerupis]|nr:hypothetical protein CLV86_2016 [Lacinutrix venerupis]
MTFQFQIFAQETEMEKKISELFFGLNLNQKPSEIVKESDFKFEYGWTSTIVDVKNHSYATEFNNHPTIKGEIKEGIFRINYDSHQEKYGIFSLTMVIRFTNEYTQIDEYERLTHEFEKYSSKTIIESTQTEDYETKSQVTVYQKNKEFEIPKLDFYFDQSDKNDFPLVVTFTTSWKMDELKKLIEKQKKTE